MKKLWQDPEYRRYMSGCHKGKKQTKEHRQKRSQSLKGHPYWGPKKRSAEFKKQASERNRGPRNYFWRNGISFCNGYKFFYMPWHPNSNNKDRIAEYNLIASQVLRRPKKLSEVVHHVNGDGLDNRHRNLLICTRSYHRWLHARMGQIYMKEKFQRSIQ